MGKKNGIINLKCICVNGLMSIKMEVKIPGQILETKNQFQSPNK